MALYDTATLGTAANRITFNNYGTYPLFRTLSRRPQQRHLRELDIPIPFESGISDFQTLVGRMAYILEGKMYPSNEADYSSGLASLRKVASLDTSQADNASDFGYVPYIYSEAGTLNKQIFLKVLYVDIREDTRQGLVQPYRFICKVKDPTIYGSPSKSASTQSINPTTSGGTAVFPFTFPIIFGSSTVTVTSTANNSGDIAAYPASIVVHGPINSPKVTNSATGTFIQVNQNLASSSDVLTISYDKDSLSIDLNGNSVLSSVSNDSDYFKIMPGINNITLSGSTVGSGAYVVVNYYDSWALS